MLPFPPSPGARPQTLLRLACPVQIIESVPRRRRATIIAAFASMACQLASSWTGVGIHKSKLGAAGRIGARDLVFLLSRNTSHKVITRENVSLASYST